jgi:hypothetical protein
MLLSTFIQIIAACLGIIGSLFFAIGIMRQSIEAMANLSGSYWDWNPHMVSALVAQKADYLFGGCIIVLAFTTQLLSFLVPEELAVFSNDAAALVPWAVLVLTIGLFFLVRLGAKKFSSAFERRITAALRHKAEELELEGKRRQAEKREAKEI